MANPIERAVAAAFPGRPIETVETQTARPGNETAAVTFADGDRVYIKTATDTTVRLEREATVEWRATDWFPDRFDDPPGGWSRRFAPSSRPSRT